jgi:WD40 repeat protein
MVSLRRDLLTVVLLVGLAAWVPSLRAEEPLPPGALRRLGDSQFRLGEPTSCVRLSPDGKILAAAGRSGIHLLETSTGREIRRLPSDLGVGFESLTFSPDGKWLAAGSRFGPAQILEVSTGRPLPTPPALQRCSSLAFSQDGKTVMAVGGEHQANIPILVWQLGSEMEPQTFPSTHDHQVGACLSGDGKWLASWGTALRQRELEREQAVMRLWDVAGGKEARKLAMDDSMVAAAFSPDGQTLATAGSSSGITLWDQPSGKRLRHFATRSGIGAALFFSPDGQTLVATSYDGAVQCWNLPSRRRLRQGLAPRCPQGNVVFTPDRRILACGLEGQAVVIWDVLSGKRLTPEGTGSRLPIASLAFTPDGQILLAANTGASISRWDVSGRFLRSVSLERSERSMGPSARVLSPDGSYAMETDLRVWRLVDTITGQEVWTYRSHARHGSVPAFSADGKLVVTDGSRGLSVLEIESGEEVHTIPLPQQSLGHAVALSPDGKGLALAFTSQPGLGQMLRGSIAFWDLQAGKELRQAAHTMDMVQKILYGANGRVLATLGMYSLTLWDSRTGHRLHQHALGMPGMRRFTAVAASPDGRLLAVALAEEEAAHTIQVFEIVSGSMRAKFQGHRGSIAALAFSPDCTLLASGAEDTTLLLWDLTGPADQPAKVKGPLSAPQLESLWADLAASDARVAWRVCGQLIASPKETVPFLEHRLLAGRPAPASAESVDRLLAALDDRRFDERERATRSLQQVGKAAEPALRRALQNKPSAEVRRRVEWLLEAIQAGESMPHELGPLRAIEILEHIGSAEARDILTRLAKGEPDAPWTVEAREASARLLRTASKSKG